MKNNNSSGFTLVELSIVLIVIALITSGILAGRAIVESSKNLKVTTGFTNYKIALQEFKNQFRAYPGDFNKAMDFWGAACGTNPAHTATSLAGTPLNDRCNGNSNMKIDWNTHEALKSFQHLYLAKLIPEPFTGEKSATLPAYTPGLNIPDTAINSNNTTYYIYYDGRYPIAGFTSTGSHFLAIGEIRPDIPVVNLGSALTPRMSYYIDQKLDDKLPRTGNFRSVNQDIVYTTNCLIGDEYDLSHNQKSQCKSLLKLEN